ncbi:zinc finger protein 384-like [Brachionus plicatilis]|uniref:Zinc finger protein 384-like n=1 Tax=Brachionus plicatilis TaxID=10195 RepID=A0A3M7R8T2_BRAPC|nr:zinc finger protein 384-like [Brachionus plicatilis]
MNTTALDLMNLQFHTIKNNSNASQQQRFSNEEMSHQKIGNSVLNMARGSSLDSRVQAGPAATSTPNPIQQQSAINHDILTNLFFKFDPNLFQKKDHLNFLLANERDSRAVFPVNQQTQDHPNKSMPGQVVNNGPKKSIPTHSDRVDPHYAEVNNQAQMSQQNFYPMPRQVCPNQSLQQQKDSLNESSSSDEQNGGKPYKCSHCFKLFRKKVHLNQHIRIHSGEKPYGCDFCEKRFTQLSHLWQHTRRHTGERPYKCDVGTCDKSFTQLSNLQSHLKTHGIQNTSSTLDQVSLANSFSGVQQKQKKARNSNKRHYCEFCHKRFATEGVIRQHQCMRQSNAYLERTDDGALILKVKQ